jgi:hypothetical protein
MRLATHATLRELTSSRYSVDLRHVARLDDGREILLLDDRGFSGQCAPGAFPTLEEVELTARTCVGPDEPVDQQSDAHWTFVVEQLRAAGVTASVDEVRRLEPDVVLDERLRAAVT